MDPGLTDLVSPLDLLTFFDGQDDRPHHHRADQGEMHTAESGAVDGNDLNTEARISSPSLREAERG